MPRTTQRSSMRRVFDRLEHHPAHRRIPQHFPPSTHDQREVIMGEQSAKRSLHLRFDADSMTGSTSWRAASGTADHRAGPRAARTRARAGHERRDPGAHADDSDPPCRAGAAPRHGAASLARAARLARATGVRRRRQRGSSRRDRLDQATPPVHELTLRHLGAAGGHTPRPRIRVPAARLQQQGVGQIPCRLPRQVRGRIHRIHARRRQVLRWNRRRRTGSATTAASTRGRKQSRDRTRRTQGNRRCVPTRRS